MCYTFGACISYLVMIGDFLPSIIETLHGHGHFVTSRYFLVTVCVVCVILPLSLLQSKQEVYLDLNKLKYTNFTGVIFIIYTTLVIIYRDGFFTKVAPNINVYHLSSCFFLAVPCTCVAFTAHYSGPRFYEVKKIKK